MRRRRQNTGTSQKEKVLRDSNLSAWQLAKQLSHQINVTGVQQLAKNKQILSIPTHQPNLKIRKWFRTQDFSTAAPLNATINTTGMAVGIRLELSVPAPAPTEGGEMFTLYGFRIYVVANSSSATHLDVLVRDIRQTNSGTNLSNVVAAFTDTSTVSGAAHVFGYFPVNDRPCWNTATPATDIFQLHIPGSDTMSFRVVVDMDVSYVRTRPAPLG